MLHRRSLQSIRRGLLPHYHLSASYLTFPLQAEVDPLAPPQIGYNYILNRVANIIFNVTEKQPTKMLQVYPEGSLATYLGKVSEEVVVVVVEVVVVVVEEVSLTCQLSSSSRLLS